MAPAPVLTARSRTTAEPSRDTTVATTRRPSTSTPPLRHATVSSAATNGLPPPAVRALRAPVSGGEPLLGSVRRPLERSLGLDLGAVRVHQDAPARATVDGMGARAVALGPRVFLG